MLVVSFGSPSAMHYALVDVVRALLAQAVDDHAVLQVVDLAGFEEQRRGASGNGKAATLVVSDCPSADLVARFAEAGRPVLVCCDALDEVVRYNMRSRGMAFAPALRFATQVLSALDGLAGLPNALRITHSRDGDRLRAVAAGVAAFLGLDLPHERFEAAMRGLSGDGRPTFRDHIARRFPHSRPERPPTLDARDAALLRELARSYAPLVEGEPLAAVAWPPALLLDWDRPGTWLDAPVPLLGPARFVICGPYLHLPAGLWRMDVRFETRDCFSDNRVEADAFDGRVLAAVALPLPRAGRYGFALDFAVADPLRPLELRIRLATGAIEGSFALLGVGLARLDDAGRLRDAA